MLQTREDGDFGPHEDVNTRTHTQAEFYSNHVTVCRRSLGGRAAGLAGSDGTLRLGAGSKSHLQPEPDTRL